MLVLFLFNPLKFSLHNNEETTNILISEKNRKEKQTREEIDFCELVESFLNSEQNLNLNKNLEDLKQNKKLLEIVRTRNIRNCFIFFYSVTQFQPSSYFYSFFLVGSTRCCHKNCFTGASWRIKMKTTFKDFQQNRY